jgi:hypothetical protein
MDGQRLFNRDEQRERLSTTFPDLSAESIERLLDEKKHRERNLVFGENVIQFNYFGAAIPEAGIPKFKDLIQAHGYRLSYYNRDGVMMASADLANSIDFNALVFGLASSALYDVVKELVLWAWKSGRLGVVTENSSDGSVKVYETITTVNITVQPGKILVYVFPNDYPDKTIGKALDQLPWTVASHQQLLDAAEYYYEHFKLKRNGNWEPISRKKVAKKVRKQKRGMS